ncbi:MAG: cysteine--tRNA ligase [Candidatus Shapirobacteria bacterium]|nr:cysteine--tRNA ligase [Candidatus Shapirobacteria bacterium]MDD5073800.1 cysteine--tRNA ligase [Candidatus Shapirobacteria bacterium]MDD5481515.1 cysteine--tRNA ligase [Candidatus Shapirobacteria bacterium]
MRKPSKKFFLFNTLTKKKELFLSLSPPRVRIYSCGPTVYGHTHLGHMRTYTNTDILLRTLRYYGYQPYQVMNITDVGHLTGDQNVGEDKLEEAAKKEKLSAWQLAEKYTAEFFGVLEKLNIARANVTPKATENITEMIMLVGDLEKRGFAYQISDGIYFDTSKLGSYGQLANVSLTDLEEGARVEKNPEKKNPTDFALWKFSSPENKRQMEWPSPWSKRGFPGWHIECSTMAMKYLSDCFQKGKFYPDRFETIDIHSGGIEHINIHHTNEIAQTEAVTGKKLAAFWVHHNWLQVEGRKMSKSLGNFYTQEDLVDRDYKDFMPLRYLFLNTHYRKVLNFTWPALFQAAQTYKELIREAETVLSFSGAEKATSDRAKIEWKKSSDEKKKISYFLNKFDQAILNDLNTPQALAVMHEVLKGRNLSSRIRWEIINKFDQVLGLNIEEQVKKLRQKGKKIPQEIIFLVDEREEIRQKKDWQKADQIRAQIEEKGYLIEDTPKGPKLTPKQ